MLVLGPDIDAGFPHFRRRPSPARPADQSSFQSTNNTRHWSLFGQSTGRRRKRTKLSRLCVTSTKRSPSTCAQIPDCPFPLFAAPQTSLALNTTVPTPVVADRSTDGLAWT